VPRNARGLELPLTPKKKVSHNEQSYWFGSSKKRSMEFILTDPSSPHEASILMEESEGRHEREFTAAGWANLNMTVFSTNAIELRQECATKIDLQARNCEFKLPLL
jgi:hypothetical protein